MPIGTHKLTIRPFYVFHGGYDPKDQKPVETKLDHTPTEKNPIRLPYGPSDYVEVTQIYTRMIKRPSFIITLIRIQFSMEVSL